MEQRWKGTVLTAYNLDWSKPVLVTKPISNIYPHSLWQSSSLPDWEDTATLDEATGLIYFGKKIVGFQQGHDAQLEDTIFDRFGGTPWYGFFKAIGEGEYFIATRPVTGEKEELSTLVDIFNKFAHCQHLTEGLAKRVGIQDGVIITPGDDSSYIQFNSDHRLTVIERERFQKEDFRPQPVYIVYTSKIKSWRLFRDGTLQFFGERLYNWF
jgi:hypothetical protein